MAVGGVTIASTSTGTQMRQKRGSSARQRKNNQALLLGWDEMRGVASTVATARRWTWRLTRCPTLDELRVSEAGWKDNPLSEPIGPAELNQLGTLVVPLFLFLHRSSRPSRANISQPGQP